MVVLIVLTSDVLYFFVFCCFPSLLRFEVIGLVETTKQRNVESKMPIKTVSNGSEEKRSEQPTLQDPTNKGDDMENLSLQVRNVTSRIINRLDASLRDGRSVSLQEHSANLNPQIGIHNLRLVMEEDLSLDDRVVLIVSHDFPETIETDVPWIQTIVQNLVHNAKKHGPEKGTIHVAMVRKDSGGVGFWRWSFCLVLTLDVLCLFCVVVVFSLCTSHTCRLQWKFRLKLLMKAMVRNDSGGIGFWRWWFCLVLTL